MMPIIHFLRKYLLWIVIFFGIVILTINLRANFEPINSRAIKKLKAPEYSVYYPKPLEFDHFSYNQWPTSEMLPRKLTTKEHSQLMHLIQIICEILGKNKIEYMIIDGSLIGSWRHWDVVPWDDDFDIIVSYDSFDSLVDLLQEKAEIEYPNLQWAIFYNRENKYEYLKVYLKNTVYAGKQYWKFPFVDIFFYEENSTHFWQQNNFEYSTKIENIFPLKLRPMGKFWLPAPNNPIGYLNSVFDGVEEDCITPNYDHRNEISIDQIVWKCSELYSEYAFVSHNCTSENVCVEKLVLKETTLAEIEY